MKETVDPKTGVKEIQSDEHVPVGPVRIAKSTPPRNPLDVMHERLKTLETKSEDNGMLAPLLARLDAAEHNMSTMTMQIASLQMAVAAIERRQMPLVHGGVALAGWNCPSCRVFNGEEKERLDACRCCGAARPA